MIYPFLDIFPIDKIHETTVPLLMVDLQGTIIAANSESENLFGYESNQLLGQPLEALLPDSMREHHRQLRHSYQKNPLPRMMGSGRDLLGIRSDGSEVPLEIGLNMIRTDRGDGVLVSVADISARKIVERTQVENLAVLNAIFRSSPFSIISVDNNGVIMVLNPAAERWLQCDKEDLLGRHGSEIIHYLHWPSGSEFASAASSLDQSPEAYAHLLALADQGTIQEVELQYVSRDGVTVPISLTVTVLRDKDGQPIGYLGLAQDISERKKAEEHIRYLAYHDTLTSLPNRTRLIEDLNASIALAEKSGGQIGVVLVDLDNFKRINDSLGHHVGDQILVSVAHQLKHCVAWRGTVARMGGDEFVVVVPGIRDRVDLIELGNEVVDCVSEVMRVGEYNLKVTPSVGICVYPDDADSGEGLLMRADTAMYAAKNRGRSNFQIFSREMALHAKERMELEHDLRHALLTDQLRLHYQPQIELATGRIVGVEALLRWHSDLRGEVMPAQLISVAEDTDLILPVGEWVLHQACKDAVKLQHASPWPLAMAVNFSPRQLMHDNLSSVVVAALSGSGLPAHLLELEITENVFMHHADELLGTLKRLRNMGIRIAIDDFGTGFSSLSYLTRFTADRLKIDLSFVQTMLTDPSSKAVTNAVIAMTQGLGIEVVAEGVESCEQRDYLHTLGCGFAQGYFLGSPQSMEQLLQTLAAAPTH